MKFDHVIDYHQTAMKRMQEMAHIIFESKKIHRKTVMINNHLESQLEHLITGLASQGAESGQNFFTMEV